VIRIPYGFLFCDCEKDQDVCDRECAKKRIMDEAFYKSAIDVFDLFRTTPKEPTPVEQGYPSRQVMRAEQRKLK
jgi:putative lipase involved disintegration of autophagic bodies